MVSRLWYYFLFVCKLHIKFVVLCLLLGPGSSSKLGNEEYNGGRPWSEAETRFFQQIATTYNYDAYFSIHSGEQQLFVPFVDSMSKKIKRTRRTTNKELELAGKIADYSNNWFRNYGLGYLMNDYSADGTLYDWMAGKIEVPYCFCGKKANTNTKYIQHL